MIRVLLLLTAVTITNLSAFAQPSLGIVGIGAGWQDTVYADSTHTFNVFLKNTGTTTFTGDVLVEVGLDTGGTVTSIDLDTVFAVTLEADSMFSYSLTHTFSSTKYVPGNNTVVIWPASGTVAVTDSIRDTVFVIFPSDIIDPNGPVPNVVAYPNPVVDGFLIELPDQHILREIRLYSTSGQLMLTANQLRVDVADLPPGMYVVHVILDDDKYALLKVLKQ